MLANDDYKVFLDDYSTVASETTQRARHLALLLIFTSVISFTALRNSLQSGYFVSEYHTLHKAWKSTLYDAHITDTLKLPLDKIIPLCHDAKQRKFLEMRHIETLREFNNYDEIYKGLLKEAFIVHVPLLGFIFHINDLALDSGIAFFTLLLIFYYSLKSEAENLDTLLKEAEAIDESLIAAEKSTQYNHLQHYYDLQSARQLLTITPDITVSGLVRTIPKILFSLPSIVYLAIVLHDYYTITFVSGSFEFLDAWAFYLSIFLCAIIWFTNWKCASFSAKNDRIWVNYHDKLLASGANIPA
jgi:hypothetical protein